MEEKITAPVQFSHYSVMLNEAIEGLNIKPDGIYLDLTLGGGGHSEQIAKKLSSGRLISLDTDIAAINASKKRLEKYSEKITFVNENFKNIVSVAQMLELDGIDGALIDLGVSSYQLDTPERGFSYMKDAPLDMRMNREDKLSAYEVVNSYSEDSIKKLLWDYGEEKFAPQIARAIIRARIEKPIQTTLELSELIKTAIPPKARQGGHHPAKKSFQAIRIEVNNELNIIEPTLNSLIDLLNSNGRLCVITFHSLEDRITKTTFAKANTPCTCPPGFPICVCGAKSKINIITKKPILPSENELEENPRSRSAKLRIVEKL